MEFPAHVFGGWDGLLEAFQAETLVGDFVAIARRQAPKANGVPELNKLTPALAVLPDRGLHVERNRCELATYAGGGGMAKLCVL